ncbi:ArdC-like ssDNA-binding domain-containing protein [Burkholderia multivorans]|uniref:ArdC-like ssDNA-binding domain-containing protein n=1 Tax=Burkholderia multivorans TaxID=87883 RepID=UPI003BF47A68
MQGKTQADRPSEPRAEISKEITDKLIAAMEEGNTPWQRPWRCATTGCSMPSKWRASARPACISC